MSWCISSQVRTFCLYDFFPFYRATAYNATRGISEAFVSVCLSVRLSSHLSNAWIVKKNEKNLCPYSYTTWNLIRPSFLTKRMAGKVATGDPSSTRNFGPYWPRWSENADFQSVFARSASTVTPREKVQLIRIGSPLRAFQWD